MEKEVWQNLTTSLNEPQFEFSHHWSYNFRHDPKRLSFVLSRYKFALKMIAKNSSILELGCSEGIGAGILAENGNIYTGVDFDEESLKTAQKNFQSSRYNFILDNFLGKNYGKFQSVVSLDVIEHINPEIENVYFDTIVKNLDENGLCIIGTPNITSSAYASEASKLGHINLYSQERLVFELKKYFFQVLAFGMNDEVMHTGFASMAHYLICIGCHKK